MRNGKLRFSLFIFKRAEKSACGIEPSAADFPPWQIAAAAMRLSPLLGLKVSRGRRVFVRSHQLTRIELSQCTYTRLRSRIDTHTCTVFAWKMSPVASEQSPRIASVCFFTFCPSNRLERAREPWGGDREIKRAASSLVLALLHGGASSRCLP